MNITKQFLVLSIAVAISSTTMTVSATGVPTVDVVSIAQLASNALQQAAEAAAQLEQAKRAISEAQSQFDKTKAMLTGNSRYGGQYNNSDLTDYLPTTATLNSWEKIYDSMDSGTLQGMRNKYGLTSEEPLQQEAFDRKLAHLHTTEAAYKANNLRLVNIQNLQAAADEAQTPQEKQDIQTRIQTEQANIANESNRLATAKELMDRQEKLYAQKQNKEFDDFMSGKEK